MWVAKADLNDSKNKQDPPWTYRKQQQKLTEILFTYRQTDKSQRLSFCLFCQENKSKRKTGG